MKNLLIVLLATLLLLAACGGEPQLDDNEDLPPPPDTGADDTVVDLQDGGDDGGDNTGDDDAKSEFDALVAKAEGMEFMVNYETTDTFSGMNGDFVMYSKGERSRMDSTSSYQGQEVESQIFVDSDGVIMCNKEGGSWTCLSMESEDEAETGNLPSDFQEGWDEPDVDVTKKGTRQIAGTTAQCYEVSVSMPEQGMMEQEVCVSPEGVMLYMAVDTPQGMMRWEATEYSTSVSDSAFEPPAEPMDMEAYMQQMMEGMPTG